MNLKNKLKALVMFAAFLPAISNAALSQNVTLSEVRPLAGASFLLIAVTPAANMCGGTFTNFRINDLDSTSGRFLYAASLTAIASGNEVRIQVADADCSVTPFLPVEGILLND